MERCEDGAVNLSAARESTQHRIMKDEENKVISLW